MVDLERGVVGDRHATTHIGSHGSVTRFQREELPSRRRAAAAVQVQTVPELKVTHRRLDILRSVGIEPKSCEGRKTEGLPCKSPVRPRQDFHRTPRYMYTGLVPQGYGLGRPFHGPICTLRSQAGAGPYRFTQRHLGLTPRSSRLAPPALHVDPETAQNSGF